MWRQRPYNTMAFTRTFAFIGFISLVSALHTHKDYVKPDEEMGPTMNVHSPYLVVGTNSSLSLSCEGKTHITWNTTLDLEQDNRVTIHERNLPKGYKTSLTVDGLQYSDTGSFSCYFTTNKSMEARTTTVYVYVTDSNHLFAPVGVYGEDLVIQAIQQGQESVIPCKPTHPSVNVTLTKYPDQQVYLAPGDVEFDPTKGFVVKYPNIFFNGLFECKATTARKTQDMNLHLLWLENSGKPPRPRFDYKSTRMNLNNRTFNITCLINCAYEDNVHLNWTYPSPTSPHIQISSVQKSEFTSPNGYKYVTLSSSLKSLQTGPAEGGRYACHATNSRGKMETAEIYVPIESPARIVSSNLDGSVVSIESGYELKLHCEMQGYPKPVIQWYKDERKIDSSTSRKYEFQHQYRELVIDDLVQSDGGRYKCVAQNRAGKASRNITIVINDTDFYYGPTWRTNEVNIYDRSISSSSSTGSKVGFGSLVTIGILIVITTFF